MENSFKKSFSLKEYCARLGFDFDYFIKNGFWVGLRQVAVILFSFLISVAFARLSSQETFGNYQLFFSLFAVVSVFSLPGLNTSLLQTVARGYEGDYRRLVRLSFISSLLGAPILLGLGAFYYSESPALGLSLFFSSLIFPFFYAPNSWDSFLQGKGLFTVSARFGLLQALVNCLATISILYFQSDNLFAILGVYLVSYAFFNILFYKRSLRYVENEKKDETTIDYGIFLTKVNIFSLVADNADKIIVGIFLGPQKLAIYYLGISVAKTLFDFSKTAVAVWLPKISRMNTALPKNYLIIFLTLAPFTVAAYFFLPVIVPILFSEKYQESIFLSQIAVIFLPLIFVNLFYVSHFFYNIRDKRIIAYYTISFAFIKIAITGPLLIFFGIKGLAFLFGFQAFLSLGVLFSIDRLTSHRPKPF